ncbi:MotA/TolQ/ExbB proton channel family protein [Halorhodospira halochloris]|uniref:MotA/TolQ/ExbB proton channel family protein n=1 Tax=Halorhodospira halochloris TaxID=1052 RepID=A0A120MZW8_HALHR|nr:MotA/TolQ/ExbB proton channel family protein [Halorhodospira halochloris]MBK1652836.1 biopolymer transporter ExbB [Halorhodospira halochloris]MCG5531503.1 MotA/TolQ/ExbB proton channel family protein [Halorhodospira halochloris]MCG5549446.1 MotA/TolQ/ExbB proton channel family protein [Halorhodospira halochloris]BAU58058.1 MotA/TolQ/ExbB proton channel family protein [Halorhodospira halochloris]
MLELIQAGGWLMLPILACSVVALAIIVERFWTLRQNRILPEALRGRAWRLAYEKQLEERYLEALKESSPLGRILAAGLYALPHGRSAMAEAVEDAGRHEAHRLERYLNTLGTIAAISPLLGLLGTVIGMIKVFGAISAEGMGDMPALSGGIAEALITTASGITVAIPALIAYRYLRGLVDARVVEMEQEAMLLIEAGSSVSGD